MRWIREPVLTIGHKGPCPDLGDPGGECVDIFDGDNKINGAPQEPLAAATSITFDWALSCAGKSGDELTVKLFNGETALIEAKGKLA